MLGVGNEAYKLYIVRMDCTDEGLVLFHYFLFMIIIKCMIITLFTSENVIQVHNEIWSCTPFISFLNCATSSPTSDPPNFMSSSFSVF